MVMRLIFILILMWTVPVAAQDIVYGKIARVLDGDTYEIRTQDSIFTVRSRYIDAPETGQPYGPISTEYVRENYLGKRVTCKINGQGVFDRYITDVIYNGKSINVELVEKGLAWKSQDFCLRQPFCLFLKQKQTVAKEQERGLWQQDNPTRPSLYRDNNF